MCGRMAIFKGRGVGKGKKETDWRKNSEMLQDLEAGDLVVS